MSDDHVSIEEFLTVQIEALTHQLARMRRKVHVLEKEVQELKGDNAELHQTIQKMVLNEYRKEPAS